MLGFGRTHNASLAQLLARKKWSRAIDLLRESLASRSRDERLRLQLADVLQRAGRPLEAVPILLELADDFALAGSAAKAIATLKRAQAIVPGEPQVEEHLAYLIAQQKAPTPDPWARAQAAAERGGGSGPGAGFLGDIEEIPDEIAEPVPAVAPRPSGDSLSDGPEGEEGFVEEVMGLIDDVIAGRLEPPPAPLTAVPAVDTPLFADFTAAELVELIRGLELRSFQPGEIIVSEGEPGRCLYLLTTGAVRAYVRDADGCNRQIRLLHEGDFFGEISMIQADHRTATVAAATRCDVLRIERETIDAIAVSHPRIWDVIRRFHRQRVGSTEEMAARRGGAAPRR